jgi:outer membrane protein assembly factor BamB
MMSFRPLTDGEVVLVPVSDGESALAALDLRTGEEQWRMPAPAGLADARVAQDGTLLLTTGSEVIAFR